MAKRVTKTGATPAKPMTRDSLQNVMSGMGTGGDKNTYTKWTAPALDQAQLSNAYRGDWMARKIVDIPAFDATREWRAWQATPQQITAIETLESTFGLQRKVMLALVRARLFGGGALVLGVEQGMSNEPLNMAALKKDCLKFIHVVSRHDITAQPPVTDITSPWYGEPEYYTRNHVTGADSQLRIHPSRVVRFVGMEYPDEQSSPKDGWGDPVLQVVADAIIAAGTVTQGGSQLVTEAQTDVINVPDLSATVADPHTEKLLKDRFAMAAIMKGLWKVLLLDKEETYERIQSNFTGIPDMLRMYLTIVSGAADIPATRFLGQSPAGLSATGESDIRNYYDKIKVEQRTILQASLRRLDDVLIISALGSRPEEVHYNWNSLWQMTPEQKAELENKKANTFKIDVDSGVHDPVVLKEARENQLIEDGTYPGLEEILEEHETEEDLVVEPIEGKPAPTGAASGVPAGEDVQSTALNGTQISSMLEVVNAVASKDLPPESAIKILVVAFPEVSETDISAIITPLATFEKPKPAPVPAPFGARPPVPPANDPAPRRVAANDARPRTLYVSRKVMNGADIVKWAKASGFATTMKAEDLHVTIAHSETPVDWAKMGQSWSGDEKGHITIPPGGFRMVERFGDAVVLMFASSELTWRWREMKDAGAVWTWPDYQPHVTISWKSGDMDVDVIKAYQGKIVLGPEIFEEIADGSWREQIVEDGKWLEK